MILYGKDLGTDPPLLVADCWSTSEGSLDTAVSLIEAVAPHVDVIKMTGYAQHRFAFDTADMYMLMKHVRQCGAGFMLTPVDIAAVSFAAEYGDAIKIASGDLLHRELIEAAAATGKPLILSTGWATEEDIVSVMELVDDLDDQYPNLAYNTHYLHCTSAYPTPVEQANIHVLRECEYVYEGYSNHVAPLQGGFEACCAAVALGASIIEVHATLSRSVDDCLRFHDHVLSFLPDELRDLRQRLDRTHACLGSGVKEPQPCELANIKARRWG